MKKTLLLAVLAAVAVIGAPAHAEAIDVDFVASFGPTHEQSNIKLTFTGGAMVQVGPARLELNALDATYGKQPYDPEEHGYTSVPAWPGARQCLDAQTLAPVGWWNCVGPDEEKWDYAHSASLTFQFRAFDFDWAIGAGGRRKGEVETDYGVLSLVAGKEAEIVLRGAKEYGSVGILLRFF